MSVNPCLIVLKKKNPPSRRITEGRPVLRIIILTRTSEKASKCTQQKEIPTGVKPSVTIKTYKNLFLNYFFLQALKIKKNVRKHHIYLNVSGKRLAGS